MESLSEKVEGVTSQSTALKDYLTKSLIPELQNETTEVGNVQIAF
jgi:hypothetical protein